MHLHPCTPIASNLPLSHMLHLSDELRSSVGGEEEAAAHRRRRCLLWPPAAAVYVDGHQGLPCLFAAWLPLESLGQKDQLLWMVQPIT